MYFCQLFVRTFSDKGGVSHFLGLFDKWGEGCLAYSGFSYKVCMDIQGVPKKITFSTTNSGTKGCFLWDALYMKVNPVSDLCMPI